MSLNKLKVLCTGKHLGIYALLAVFFLAPVDSQSQTFELTYSFPSDTPLKYKRLEDEEAYAELHNSISANIVKRKETFFHVTKTGSAPEGAIVEFVQDTVLVEETPPPHNVEESIKINNLISHVPVDLLITPHGELKRATPHTSFVSMKGVNDDNFNDIVLAQSAMFLPTLPKGKIEIGKTWSANAKDTLIPNPDLGEGNSLRIIHSEITYRAEDIEEVQGYSCIKVSWNANRTSEEKYIAGKQEIFTEEHTKTKGTYYFAPKESLLVKLEQQVDTEHTTVYYGDKQGIVPYTNTKTSTIILQ